MITHADEIRKGNVGCRYKAGALSYGMKLFGDTIDYVAVFDSDFQPSPSFLRDLVPYLVANPTVGWVQVGAVRVMVRVHTPRHELSSRVSLYLC
jgi:cellulose synthase/poly-beta-1,6-N-acetylglucosamine synthase-like glycosyltransferase